MWKGKTHPHQGVGLSRKPAKVPKDQKQTSLQAQCWKGARAGTTVSIHKYFTVWKGRWQIYRKETMWWVHNERIPGERTCALNLEWGVELGRAESTFQVEKNILSQKRKFTKRGRQLWSQGRVSKTDWIFKSLDTNRWAVRLFETSVWVYFYMKEDEQDLLLTSSELPVYRILKFLSHLYLPYLSSLNYLKGFSSGDSTHQESIWKCMQSAWITTMTGRHNWPLGRRARIRNALHCSVKSCLG